VERHRPLLRHRDLQMSEADYCTNCGDVQRLPRGLIEELHEELAEHLEDALRLYDRGERNPDVRDHISSASARAYVLLADARGWCVSCSRSINAHAADVLTKSF
jgi:hypothetical protein